MLEIPECISIITTQSIFRAAPKVTTAVKMHGDNHTLGESIVRREARIAVLRLCTRELQSKQSRQRKMSEAEPALTKQSDENRH